MKFGSRALPRWIILGLLFVEPSNYACCQIRGDIDYGIGFVEPASCTVYSHRSTRSSIVAVIQGDKIRFASSANWESRIDYAIMIVYNSTYGLPLLGFSTDSQWVKVSLDSRMRTNPPSGWIHLGEIGTEVKLWSQYWFPGFALHFIDKKWEAFYDTIAGGKLDMHQTMPQFDSSSYSLRVVCSRGNWMKVIVESPEPEMMNDEDIAKELGTKYFHAQAWIRFLNGDGRPRVFGRSND